MIREAIQKVVEGSHLTQGETVETMNEIMSGEATSAQISCFITALRLKGETIEEIAGAAQVMREKATRIQTRHRLVVDTCGTGGDQSHTFNISTTAAFVTAGAGIPVAKHGNQSVSSQSGSADVLSALGVNLEISPQEAGQCLDEIGIGFLFAPVLHSAMKHAIGPRREIGIRTIFNVLGPLTNPAGAQAQLVGVYAKELTVLLAKVLKNLGTQIAFVVHGHDGLDEITTTDETQVSSLTAGKVETYNISPHHFDMQIAKPEDLSGGTPAINAEITRQILDGETGPKRDIVILNAAAAIVAGGKAMDLKAGCTVAKASIDSGRAKQKLESLIEFTNKP
ncbi:anthranilate phosphoribosyltransferase [Candidatus Poribacteria bacterium]|jgi:anthranilate phosphoribosyltransferase|nr:anthranilate phosphoribosyltransferase [Candidatus Poribacteria bacterium]MDP6595874.1 anthranilate phosphoribosyltransferase [Candidatus Poribacteria bacterium]MDP6749613.1 anthranilate phosphoribosyltransferase [Candidatus Poribacteria bacterium]MDP6996403.1 anthranilate phosphoribosyltransferase [Candidatus Poribacteria bacterium]